VQSLGKIPIVVNDSRGFYTSRTFGTFVMEGAAMLGEGIPAAVIENAGIQAGMPVGPLAVLDETALSLSVHVMEQTMQDFAAEGRAYTPSKGEQLVAQMVKEFKRPGRAAGAGFYDYPAGGKKTLWPGLTAHFGRANASADTTWDMQDIKDRLLYRQAIETARCLHEGVLTTVHDANIGSIFGIGFPVWTGGALQFIFGIGIDAFAKRAGQLAIAHGTGFALSAEVLSTLRQHQPQF
jgi:3-hydroxyacyl-CoA dehydrogenase / enoyl-CoA hydratase / 3-hydroxybutyryl-CoA epimerase